MRATLALVLAIGAAAAPAPAPEPPLGAKPKTYEELAPVILPAKVIDQKPLIRPTAKRQLVQYGPFDLPGLKPAAAGAKGHGNHEQGGIMSGNPISGMNMWPLLKGDLIEGVADMLWGAMDPEGTQVSKTLTEGICRDCSILSSKIDAVFENGTRADLTSGVYLHHIIALNGGTEQTRKNDLFHPWIDFCSGSAALMNTGMSVMSSLNWMTGAKKPDVFAFGAVDEFRQWFTTEDGKLDSGFYRGPKDTMFTQAELINYRPEPQKVYLQFDVEFVPGKAAKNAVTMFSSATDCDKGIGFLGKGVGDQQAGDLNVNANGIVLSARGHMHDGGETMTVSVNGKPFCVSKAEYGTAYEVAKPATIKADAPANVTKKALTTISKMSDCLTQHPVKAGDKVKLVAHYNLEAHPLRESGGEAQMQMGLVAFTWVPS